MHGVGRLPWSYGPADDSQGLGVVLRAAENSEGSRHGEIGNPSQGVAKDGETKRR